MTVVCCGIVPDIDIMLDDLTPYNHDPNHYVRRSNCCSVLPGDKLVRINYLNQRIKIYNIKDDNEEKSMAWLSSFPALASNHYSNKLTYLDNEEEARIISETDRNARLKTVECIQPSVGMELANTQGAEIITVFPILLRISTISS